LYVSGDLPDSFVEDAFEVSLGQGRAFKVFMRFDFLSHGERLLIRNRLHLLRAESFRRRFVLSQIQFGANENDRNAWGVMLDFRIPLG
jgi:hypothetical protein